MTTREVILDGGSPWGFRMHGGADVHQPLKISRVNPGSKASIKGVREGDLITSINGQSTRDVTNSDAHALLKSAGDKLRLGLNEDCSGSPKRRQFSKTPLQETHQSKTINTTSLSNASLTSIIGATSDEQRNEDRNGLKENGESRKSLSSSTDSSITTLTKTTTTSGAHSDDDEMPHGSKHRKRRNRRKAHQQQQQQQQKNLDLVEAIETSDDYRVESPKTVKNVVVKSKSLDSEEMLRITELSECETETEAESTAIVAEVDEVKSSDDPQEKALLSPEEEVHLRQFIVGLDLVNSAEEAAKVVENRSESNSTKSKRAKKREQLAQYFLPVYQNPRFLDAISEEGSDSSDRETLRVRIIEGPTIVEEVVCRTETIQSIEQPEIVHLDEDESSASDSQQTPPPTPDVDSSGSDSTNRSSPITTLENPMTSSVGDVASLLQEPQPLTLKDICLKRMVALPFGDEVLEELAETAHHLIPNSFPAAPTNPNDSSRLLDLIRSSAMNEETFTSNYQFVPTKSGSKQEQVISPQKDAIYGTTSETLKKTKTEKTNSNKNESKEFIIETVLENNTVKEDRSLNKLNNKESNGNFIKSEDIEADLKSKFQNIETDSKNEGLVKESCKSKEVIIKTLMENNKESSSKMNEKMIKMNGNMNKSKSESVKVDLKNQEKCDSKEVIIKTVVEKDETASNLNKMNQASNLDKSKSQSVGDVTKNRFSNEKKEFLIKTVLENSTNQGSNLNKSKSQSVGADLKDRESINKRSNSKEVIIKTVVENSSNQASNLNKSKSQSVGDVKCTKEKSGSREFIIKTVLERPEVEGSNLNKFFSQSVGSDLKNHNFVDDKSKSKEVFIKTIVEESKIDGINSKMSQAESVSNNLKENVVEKPKFEGSNLNKFLSQSVGNDLKNHSFIDDKTKSKEVIIKTVVEKSSVNGSTSNVSKTESVKSENFVKSAPVIETSNLNKIFSQSVESDLKNYSFDDKSQSKEVFIKTVVGNSSNKLNNSGSNLNKFLSQSVGSDLKNHSFDKSSNNSKEFVIKTVLEEPKKCESDAKNCSFVNKSSWDNLMDKSGFEESNLNKFFSKSVGSDLKNHSLNEDSNNSKEFVIKTVLEKDHKFEETNGKKIQTLSEESKLKKFICNTEVSESESRLKQFISENCRDIDASKLEGGNLKRFMEESSSTKKEESSNLKRFASESDLKIKPKEFTIRTILEEEDDEEDGAKKAVGNLQRLMSEARSRAQNLGEWLETAKSSTSRRRRSLPHEFYVKQMQYLIEKEKKIQEELESLEMEKRKLNSEMFTAVPVPLNEFEPEAAMVKGRPKTTPSVEPHEKLRQEMYDEYMDKVAEREERKHHKIIKISLNEQDDILVNGNEEKATNELEKEFLDKARQRLDKRGGVMRDDSDEMQQHQQNHREVLILDGDEITASNRIPKHLRELIDQDGGRRRRDALRICRVLSRNRIYPQPKTFSLLHEIDANLVIARGFLLARGVWSPGQQRNDESRTEESEEQQQQRRTEGGEPIPPVWTPRSAGSSPTAERKEFRPVNFESPVLGRKTRTKSDGSATLTQEAGPSWKAEPKPEARLPTSFSAPGPGFSECSRLPKAQNPTITLLQKAREGQIPKASSALEQEKQQRCATRSNEPSNFSNDPVHQVRNDCVSDSDGERPKKIVISSPKKYEGIGPTTKDGMPITLRSEVRDTNMSQWYKKMYDTIHKQKPSRYDDDEYVTVRYKQRRGRYPYTTGYLSEPEPGAYDSDATMSDCKYATLDRRRPQPPANQDNGMSSTLPRNASTTTIRYRPSDVQHANDVYKNQPGRIENYQPGKSSISEHEAKKWWDEVMDIFDGWLDDHSAAPSCNYLLNKAIVRSHLEQQKRMPTTKGYMSQALKESGYESDSPLVFRRRDDTAQLLSALEQREVYRNIQRGGEVPIHGLRKPAPERPKDFLCYPLSVRPQVFGTYKRTAPSQNAPNPPKRKSSRNNSTLRLIVSKPRHETCFTSKPAKKPVTVKPKKEMIKTPKCCNKYRPCKACDKKEPKKVVIPPKPKPKISLSKSSISTSTDSVKSKVIKPKIAVKPATSVVKKLKKAKKDEINVEIIKEAKKREKPKLGASKIYLNQTKPVSQSKFRSLDPPKSPKREEKRSCYSLPPTKLIFSETARPISPTILVHKVVRSPSCRKIKARKESKLNSEEKSVKPLSSKDIADCEQWKRDRKERKTESEFKMLCERLNGSHFKSKETRKWHRDLDRGLRARDKSVEDIRELFERSFQVHEDCDREKERMMNERGLYKPLWRGNSVHDLAQSLNEQRRSKSEGRSKEEEDFLTRGVGSRIWSSLSMEQVNVLKEQLIEIYGSPKKDNSIEVSLQENRKPKELKVRRNSGDNCVLSEVEKQKISQSLSKEILDRQRRKFKNSPALVLAKETRGAVAAADANVVTHEMPSPRTCYSLEMSEDDQRNKENDFILVLTKDEESKNNIKDTLEIWAQPKKALIKTDALDANTTTSASASGSGSTDGSIKTVISVGKPPIAEKVEYFESRKEDTYTPTVYKASEDVCETTIGGLSQSHQDLKELYGETLSARREIHRSRSLSPCYDESYASLKAGDVSRLRNRFENERVLSRSSSDPHLEKKVDSLRKRYEFPAIAGRGRSRTRKGGAILSPQCLQPEDRFMPHINIISKIASLYPQKKSGSEGRMRSNEELAGILGIPIGEVEKLRAKFDCPDVEMSLLGHMFTSSPNVHELRDIAQYLTGSWTAHRYPKTDDNSIRPKSTSPPRSSTTSARLSSILKNNQQRQSIRPSVTFKEPEVPPPPPPKGQYDFSSPESPRKYVENEVTIHYRTPVRQEIKEALSEDELAKRQADAMRKIYEDERRRKYLQELHDMKSRRHTDNFIPSQKSPIALNRYDDFMEELSPRIKPRPRSPEPRLVARALYNFVGQTSRELTFKKGDVIHIRRQVDKNWYEGEINAMVGLFPANYVEIVPYDGIKTTPRKSHEGQARAKYNFIAQTHLELSLAKGELVVITRRVDDNWFEGKIGGRKGIFPVSYVEVLIDPSDPPQAPTKPVASPAAHSMLLNGSAGGKESMGTHSYVPTFPTQDLGMSYRAKPVQVSGYSSLKRNPVEDPLHIETHSEPIPYRALYKYKPQNEDELELLEGDTVYVLEKCDDGWYVGSSDRTGAFGTFPGNYVDRI